MPYRSPRARARARHAARTAQPAQIALAGAADSRQREEQVRVSAAHAGPPAGPGGRHGQATRPGGGLPRPHPGPPPGRELGQVAHVLAAGGEVIGEPPRVPAGRLPAPPAHHRARQHIRDSQPPDRLPGNPQPLRELPGRQEIRASPPREGRAAAGRTPPPLPAPALPAAPAATRPPAAVPLRAHQSQERTPPESHPEQRCRWWHSRDALTPLGA